MFSGWKTSLEVRVRRFTVQHNARMRLRICHRSESFSTDAVSASKECSAHLTSPMLTLVTCRRPQSAVIEELDTSDTSSDGTVDAILEYGMHTSAAGGGAVGMPLSVQELMTVASRMVSSSSNTP